MYKIVRYYFRGKKVTLKRGVTLEEAQRHCASLQTSSQTASGYVAKRRTASKGMWFDGYVKE
jgi:hypothetical protein